MSSQDQPKPITINGVTYEEALADGEYDAIFLSTGLKECVLAGLCAARGMKVLQMDRNPYYGGACASLNLEELHKHYNRPYDAAAVEAKFGKSRGYCVDLVPKLIMAYGKIVRMLVQTGVTRYVEFNEGVAGSYVVAQSTFSGNKIYRVPVTPAEALATNLVGVFQKKNLVSFVQWLDKYQVRDKTSDEMCEASSPDDFRRAVEAYYLKHNPEKAGEVPGLVEQYKGRRLALVTALERKYVLPVFPNKLTFEFATGPLGLRVEPRKFQSTASTGVASAIRVVGFQPNADGTPGQAERLSASAPKKIQEYDIIFAINETEILGMPEDQAMDTLKKAARPVKITFIRPSEAEVPPKEDLRKITMKELYEKYGLDADSQTFIGHAMALHTSDAYLSLPAEATVDKIHLYGRSVGRYGQNSPYLYPRYGLSTLPEGFSRLAAVHGGTVMLRAAPDEILYDQATGKVAGVRVGKTAARAKMIVGDASYFEPSKSRLIRKIVRSICILNHPIANTSGGDSCQIIMPAKTIKGRIHDIYVSCLSASHSVAPKGAYICICSTVTETANPVAELDPAIALLGEIGLRFDSVTEMRGQADEADVARGIFILDGLDETSHFESAADDLLSCYQKMFGQPLDLNVAVVDASAGEGAA